MARYNPESSRRCAALAVLLVAAGLGALIGDAELPQRWISAGTEMLRNLAPVLLIVAGVWWIICGGRAADGFRSHGVRVSREAKHDV